MCSADSISENTDSIFVKYLESGSPFEIKKDESEENIYAIVVRFFTTFVGKLLLFKLSSFFAGHNQWTRQGHGRGWFEEQYGGLDERPANHNKHIFVYIKIVWQVCFMVFGKLAMSNYWLNFRIMLHRYLHLMHLLKPIAYDVAISLSQLFEYYFYAVFVFFATENVNPYY